MPIRPDDDFGLEPLPGEPGGPPVEEDLSKAPPEAPPEEAAAGPEKQFRVKLRNGKEYTGKSEREILLAMADEQDRMAMDLEDRTRQNLEASGKYRYQEDHTPPPVKPGEKWDPQVYFDLLAKDPMEARRYQDHWYYGVAEGEDPAAMFRFAYSMTDKIADTLEVADFHRQNPDLKLSELETAMVLRRLDAEHLTLEARNLDMVVRTLQREGRIVPRGTPGNVEYEDIQLGQPAKPASRGATAQRGTGGGDRAAAGTEPEDLEALSLDELKKKLRKSGVLQH